MEIKIHNNEFKHAGYIYQIIFPFGKGITPLTFNQFQDLLKQGQISLQDDGGRIAINRIFREFRIVDFNAFLASTAHSAT